MNERPEDIAKDIWDAAYEALHPASRHLYETSPFSMVQHLGIAKAIQAERERCHTIAFKLPVGGLISTSVTDLKMLWKLSGETQAGAIADAIIKGHLE